MRCGLQFWKCELCKAHNDVLNIYCWSCKAYKPLWVTALYQMRVEFERGIYDGHGILGIWYDHREGRIKGLYMTPNEELHAKFFSEEAVLVQPMNDIELDEHIHELETIAREAKARILAATEEKRTRAAKKGNKAWRVEPIGPDPTVTDSINKVKQRSQRMGKLESMREKLAGLGIDDSEIEQMISKMVAKARKEPESLKAEAKLKEDLKTPKPPTIVTAEEKQAQAQRRKELDKQDKEEEKRQKEAEKDKEARVHVDKHGKLILAQEPEAKVEPPSGDNSPVIQPASGKLDLSKLKFS